MFEDSLVESRNRLASRSRRWIALGSFGLQCLVVGMVVVVPLTRPGALPFRAMMAPVVVIPAVRKPPVRVEHVESTAAESSAAAPAPPLLRMDGHRAIVPTMHPVQEELAEVAPGSLSRMGSGRGGLDPLGIGTGTETRVTVATPKRKDPLPVSSGVVAGLLLGEIRPVYPRIAVAAHVEGTVVIEAIISKAGAIESARVMSGPAILQGAAIEAVKAARYRPYRLNGEATEVQTTITVNFRLGS